jgi:hypothetical protein
MNQTTADPERAVAGPLGEWGLGLRDLRSLIGLVAIYAIIVWLVSELASVQEFYRPLLYPARSILAAFISLLFFLVGYVIYLPLVARETRPLRRIWRLIKTYLLTPRQLTNLVVPFLLLPFFMSAFTSFKSMLPEIVPFYLDPAFMSADKIVHFGWHPFEITHALFGGLTASSIINTFYHLWFLVMWAAMMWHLVRLSERAQRLQFLLSFILLWTLLGSLAALVLSSAGPVYYGQVTGLADPFAPLMSRLYEIDATIRAAGGGGLPALEVQETLWGFYTDQDTTYGSGISAMPSLHVAITALIAMSAYRIQPLFGYAMWGFTAMIVVGAVHLGWHYAIDGYVSIAATVVIWRLAGRFAEKEVARTA